jgi:hypothetical protein
VRQAERSAPGIQMAELQELWRTRRHSRMTANCSPQCTALLGIGFLWTWAPALLRSMQRALFVSLRPASATTVWIGIHVVWNAKSVQTRNLKNASRPIPRASMWLMAMCEVHAPPLPFPSFLPTCRLLPASKQPSWRGWLVGAEVVVVLLTMHQSVQEF